MRENQNVHFTTADPASALGIPRTTVASALMRWHENGAIEGLSNPAFGVWMYRPHADGRQPAAPEAPATPPQGMTDALFAQEMDAVAGAARPTRRSRQLRREDLLRVIGNAGTRVLVADEHDRIYVLQELET
jgi:hypothetical protein